MAVAAVLGLLFINGKKSDDNIHGGSINNNGTNVDEGDGFKTYPLYALGFIKDINKERNIIQEVDLKALQVPQD